MTPGATETGVAGDGSSSPADAAVRALALAFARQIEGWALARDAAPQAVAVLRQAAFALSLATSQGDVCLDIADIAAGLAQPLDAAALRALLLASDLVGTPAAPRARPMVLDDQGRLYLHRYFDYERRLARRLVQAASSATDAPAHDSDTRERLATLFPRDAADGAVDWQQAAAALALRKRLTVISGGPGTGKTTTVVKLLACLLAQQPDARIALTAPTGKAAARMSEAIRARAAGLPMADALRARLPEQASTVHRLLGVTPGPGGFVHDADKPLAIDVLVVDEASMLDLALATRLLEAVPPHARIVLLGDKDQLAAVESGSVFAEISADPSLSAACRAELDTVCGLAPGSIQSPAVPFLSAPDAPDALPDTVVWFTHNFRFAADSGIGRLAADINGARPLQALQTLRTADRATAPGDSVRWLADSAARPGAAVWQELMDGYAPFADALRRDPRDVAAVMPAFNRFRALCAVREGPRGASAVNLHAAQALRRAIGDPLADAPTAWYVGRPVIVLRNDPVLKLFNGDIGIALPDADGALMVHFPASGGTGWRAVAPLRLPAHQTAFAMTVHKAQGSEFDTVLVLLPERRSRVVTRELLYTAVTRARRRVVLCAPGDVLTAAIQSPTLRRSGLLTRLAEAAGA